MSAATPSWIKHFIGYDDSFGNGTKFTDLNFDDQLMILEKLDISSLLSMAEINKDYQQVAGEVFRRKFGQDSVHIRTSPYEEDIVEFYKKIQIQNFDKVSKIFIHFGHYISKVDVHSIKSVEKSAFQRIFHSTDEHEYDIKDVLKLLSNYSDDLKDLTLSHCDLTPLKYVNRPFYNVENLTLNSYVLNGFDGLNSETLSFQELFPNLRRLYVNSVYLYETSSLLVPFKQLEEIRVKLLDQKCYREIYNFILKNPQLRSFSFFDGSIDLIKVLSINSPNLENLDVLFDSNEYLRYGDEAVHFKRVKRLTIHSQVQPKFIAEFPQNIYFEELEELDLEVNGRTDVSNEWMEFIRRNTHLEKLKLSFWHMNETQLMLLAGHVPNLTEADLILDKGVTAEKIFSFLKECNKLKIIKLEPRSAQVVANLRIQIENEWKIFEMEHSYTLIKQT